jgi:uncharacterized membrane protein
MIPSSATRRSILGLGLATIVNRPRLMLAMTAGVLVALGLTLTPNTLGGSTRAVLSWDAAALFFVISIMPMMAECGIAGIRSRAAAQDEGRGMILALSVVAAAASVWAIGIELGFAKNEHGLIKSLRIALAFSTIALSWLFVHLIFALHYAHEFYAPTAELDDGDTLREGLNFPGHEPPDYWDFVHFAIVIGVACQTADIEFASKTMRRTGTVHGLVSFAFNTVVLALTINLLAGLF